MTDHANELRRYARKIAHPAGDVPSVMLAAADEIERLAARLEAAEKDVAMKEDAIASMSTVIKRLDAQCDAAERERDNANAAAVNIALEAERLQGENEAMRAKIEAMERQKPVGKFTQHPSNGLWEQDGYGDNHEASPLYALPGAKAQNATSVPSEEDESVRKAWSRFSNELHRGPDAPYPGMSEAFEQHFSQSFTDRDWRAESGTWAAAWKAAKRHGAQAQPALSVPEGWKLVPIVSTDEMDNAGADHVDGYLSTAQSVWDAMLAAAPEAKP